MKNNKAQNMAQREFCHSFWKSLQREIDNPAGRTHVRKHNVVCYAKVSTVIVEKQL